MPTSRTQPRPTRPRPPRRRSWFWRYRRILLLLGILGATAVTGVVFVLFQIPLPEQPSLGLLNQTTYLTDASGTQRLATFHGAENRTVVQLTEVPQVVQQAVIATEDRNFFKHAGVDPIGLVRAVWTDVRRRDTVQGGSTITQQYVKNAYVGQERSLWRKIREAIISVKIERRLSKSEILERYLNTIYFGRGAYGVQAASQAYFGKNVSALGLKEAAFLAGIIKSPVSADPAVDAGLAIRNRGLTLLAMEKEGEISPAQRQEVEATPLYGPGGYVQSPAQLAAQTQVTGTDKGTQYFVEYVRKFLVERYGPAAVYGNGLRVKTTLDLTMQAQAYDSVYNTLNRRGDPDGALVALDENGRVKAMVGGRNWAASQVNLAVGRDGGGRGRQAGSTFKPFVLAEAVREGYSVESTLPAPAKITIPKVNNGADWEVNNYEGEAWGRLNLIDATADSANTVYAQLIAALGPAKVADMAKQMGVVTPLPHFPSIALGTTDVSVLEMADSYLTLATRGLHVDPQVVLEVDDAKGQVIERFAPDRERVLERSQADVVNQVLRQVVERGTGKAAAFGKPCAGKTGTTSDYGDAWFIGYTPRLTTAVWMGYSSGQSTKMTNVHGRKIAGGTLPAEIFHEFMTSATAGVDTGDFPAVAKYPGRLLSPDAVTFTTGGSSGSSTSSTTDAGSSSDAGVTDSGSVIGVDQTTTSIVRRRTTPTTFSPTTDTTVVYYPDPTEPPTVPTTAPPVTAPPPTQPFVVSPPTSLP